MRKLRMRAGTMRGDMWRRGKLRSRLWLRGSSRCDLWLLAGKLRQGLRLRGKLSSSRVLGRVMRVPFFTLSTMCTAFSPSIQTVSPRDSSGSTSVSRLIFTGCEPFGRREIRSLPPPAAACSSGYESDISYRVGSCQLALARARV